MADCSAIISSGTVEFKKTAAAVGISVGAANNIILDSIEINGDGYNRYGISFYTGQHNSTFNNIEIHDSDGAQSI